MSSKEMTAGIAVDNYKIGRFTKALTDKGFSIKDTTPFSKGVSMLRVTTDIGRLSELHMLLIRLQKEFTNLN